MEKIISVDLTKDTIKREKFLESLKLAIKQINSSGIKTYVIKSKDNSKKTLIKS